MTTATRAINVIRWQWALPYMPLASRPVLRNMLLMSTILLTSFATIGYQAYQSTIDHRFAGPRRYSQCAL